MVSRLTTRTTGMQVCQTEPELFFSTKPNEIAEAKRACVSCPFWAACRLESLRNGERSGVWGGLSAKRRLTMTPEERESEIGRLENLRSQNRKGLVR